MVVLPEPRLPKNTYVVSFGLKPRKSLWMYNEVLSWFVFSAVLSVKGLRLRPNVFSRSVVGMAATASATATAQGLFLQHCCYVSNCWQAGLLCRTAAYRSGCHLRAECEVERTIVGNAATRLHTAVTRTVGTAVAAVVATGDCRTMCNGQCHLV
jgi:hypothetical protein